jgi:hypothetical protein
MASKPFPDIFEGSQIPLKHHIIIQIYELFKLHSNQNYIPNKLGN